MKINAFLPFSKNNCLQSLKKNMDDHLNYVILFAVKLEGSKEIRGKKNVYG